MRPGLIIASMSLLVALVGCSDDDSLTSETELGCLSQAPAGLGRICEGLGECPMGLVCDDRRCALPATILPTSTMPLIEIGDLTFRAELARTTLEHQRGLSERSCMTSGTAMLFEFVAPTDTPFTTSEMRYAIDIAFIGDDGKVFEVMTERPAGSPTPWEPQMPARWVVETQAKALSELQIGDRLFLPRSLSETAPP